jgi:hypothetical protein
MVVCSGIFLGCFLTVDKIGQIPFWANMLGVGVSFFLLFISLIQIAVVFERNIGNEKTYNISEHENN